jgi:hypothetical protein
MVLNDDGVWTWGPYVMESQKCKIELEWQRKEHNALVQNHNDLVRKWNHAHCVKVLGGQPVGRPLAASEAQIVQVLNLRNAGMSLRAIADETSLGLNTVRTIIDKKRNAGRVARRAHMLMRKDEITGLEEEAWEIEREPDARQRASKFKRQKRTIDALPKQAQRVVEEGRALIKEAKGLGRARL